MPSPNIPIDIVLLGMIAAFLILRLRSILGRDAGAAKDRPLRSPLRQLQDSVRKPELPAQVSLPAASAPQPIDCPEDVAAALEQVKSRDPNFSQAGFITVAENVFKTVVDSYAAGDRTVLRTYLSPQLYQVFDGVIAAREAAGQRVSAQVREIRKVTLLSANITRLAVRISVEFVSDQVSFTKSDAAEIIDGTEALVEITDVWDFEHDLAQPSNAWRVTDTRGV